MSILSQVHQAVKGKLTQAGHIPWISKFFLFLDVAICVEISMELPLIQLVDLLLLQNKQIDTECQQAAGPPSVFCTVYLLELNIITENITSTLMINGGTVCKDSATSW